MADENILEWIRSQRNSGLTNLEIKNILKQNGYGDDAIKKAFRTLLVGDFKNHFRPSPLKLVIPIIIIILIVISFTINSIYMAESMESLAEGYEVGYQIQQLSDDFNKKSLQNNIDFNLLIAIRDNMSSLENKRSSAHRTAFEGFKPLYLGNMYMVITGMYYINPFFPLPCELNLADVPHWYNHCRYFGSADSINGIIKYDTLMNNGGMMSMFYGSLPEYKGISVFLYVLHSIILLLIVYSLIGLSSFGRYKIRKMQKKIKIYVMLTICVLPIFIFLLFESAILIALYPLILLFVISVNLNDRHNGIFLIVIFLLIIISFMAGIFVMSNILNNSTFVRGGPNYHEVEYEILFCNNTKILSMDEKIDRSLPFINETWNVCNVSCREVCQDRPGLSQIVIRELRGDKPSCFCVYD